MVDDEAGEECGISLGAVDSDDTGNEDDDTEGSLADFIASESDDEEEDVNDEANELGHDNEPEGDYFVEANCKV